MKARSNGNVSSPDTFDRVDNFSFVAGELALDFVNTRTGFRKRHWSDLLTSYQNLLNWSYHAKVLNRRGAEVLMSLAHDQPADAEKALGEAVTLRNVISELTKSVMVLTAVSDTLLSQANTYFKRAGNAKVLTVDNGNIVTTWPIPSRENMDCMLWPIVDSATHLFTHVDNNRIKCCASDECGWMFVDTSKNGRRRWCQMSVCGNRAKSRRHLNATAQA